MAGATIGNQAKYIDLGYEDVRRVGVDGRALVRSSQVLNQAHQGVEDDIDGPGADLQQGGTGDENDVILSEVLAGGACPVRKLHWGEQEVSTSVLSLCVSLPPPLLRIQRSGQDPKSSPGVPP